MGYDITFHPISEEQMDAWYFSLMDSLAKGDTSRLEAVAEEAGMDPFYINKYRDLMSMPPGRRLQNDLKPPTGFIWRWCRDFSASIIMCSVQPFLSWRKSTR